MKDKRKKSKKTEIKMDKSLLQKKIISVSATFRVALSTVSGKKKGVPGQKFRHG